MDTKRRDRIICYLLFAICYSALGVGAKAGDILRGNTGSSNSPAASSYYGGNQAAMSQLQNNANDILTRAADAMKSVQAMQQAARNAALNAGSNVPNGLTTGGLQIATGSNAEWTGANQPTQSTGNGQTAVTIQQTSSQAILNWQTFNVGKNTTVDFNQSAGRDSANTWVALNRIFSGVPSQILGSIKAQGQVYLINQNGIIFGGSSHVNVSTLLAAAATITDSQFINNGIYSPVNTTVGQASFTDGLGTVVVDPGAELVTNAPLRTGDRGGAVILLGGSVSNEGSITTADGQTLLAAGQNFYLIQGYSITPGTTSVAGESNTTSTTLGIDAAVSNGGTTTNTGLIMATTGDITMVGHKVTQSGVLIATSSVDQRGTIHLQTSLADATASITLAPGSVTYIGPDSSSGTALEAQQVAAYTEDTAYFSSPLFPGGANDEAQLPDRVGISRIEITTGGTVDFAGNSLTSATAGQIAVYAGKRAFVSSDATLDVSGLLDVSLPMSTNNLAVNIQGFELRDDPNNRNTEELFNNTVYVDLRQLVEVPASSSYNAPYNTENRYYTSGGLLEVSGELNNVGSTIQQWDTIGGAITLVSSQVISQKGSVFDIAGGTIKYQSGYLKESYVIASNGYIYNVNTAPAGLTYTGVFDGFTVNHPRWNVTENYQNVVSQPSEIYVQGYVEGRDAGTLTIDAPTSVFEGTIQAQTYNGPEQDAARPSNVTDPFLLTESTVTLNGSLVLGALSQINQGITYSSNVVFGDNNNSLTASLTPTAPLANSLLNNNIFSASQINNADLGALTVDVQAPIPKSSPGSSRPNSTDASSKILNQGPKAKGDLIIQDPLAFADGAQISLTAANVVLDGGITATDGEVTIDAVSYPQKTLSTVSSSTPAKAIAEITLAPDATIDTEGLWTNAFLDPTDITGEGYVNGGNVTLSSNQGITLATGSLIDTSSGAAILPNKKVTEGSGGNISIEADQVGDVSASSSSARSLLTVAQAISHSALVLDGRLQSYGVKSGGALTLQAFSVLIGNGISSAPADTLVLASSFFHQGFSSYTIHGMESVTVEPGTEINVTEPVYMFSAATYTVPTGTSPSAAFGSPVLMPVYVGNPDTATVTQRPGASLSLLAGVSNVGNTSRVAAGGAIDIGTGSTINVDPGQSINVGGAGQITVDGTLRAPSGSIEIVNYRPLGGVGGTGKVISYEPEGLSIWIGSNSVLDVSAQAFVAFDRFGRPYGLVPNGGSIVIGSTGGTQVLTLGGTAYPETISTDAFVIIRPGAVLNASGTSSVLDLDAGSNPTEGLGGTSVSLVQRDPVYAASNGGSISLSSYEGIYIDGTLEAAAGGPGGAGGTLAITFAGPIYQVPPPFANGSSPDTDQDTLVPDNLRVPRSIVIGQGPSMSLLPPSLQPGQPNRHLQVGYAYLSADAVNEGGFANLLLYAANSILFKGNVTLSASESISLTATSLADEDKVAQVRIAAPYVLFASSPPQYGVFLTSTGGLLNFQNTLGQRYGRSNLTIDADLIDLQSAEFGDFEQVPVTTGSPAETINYLGFNDVNFVSQGDIRLFSGLIESPGSLTFTAAQLYPVSGASATVEAGVRPLLNGQVRRFIPGTSISIYRISDVDPALPQSVFGRITFDAQTINQDGIVRVPLGSLVFGVDPSGTGSPLATKAVNFLPGSITSVSANGLTTPYGGTTDGITYLVDGQTFTTNDVIDGIFSGNRGIKLQGYSVSVSKGALLDLSGGGNLFGEGFISGRGGSLNVLANALIDQNPSYTFSSSGDAVYALVPGVQSYAPATVDTDSGYTLSTPSIGQQITIPAGIPGLPAGTYTLMPANYALLPDAFRVELGGRGNTNQPAVLSLVNGSYEVNVNEGVANSDTRNALPNEAIITPASVVETYSDYDLESYSAVAVSQALRFDQPRALLPIDASTLMLDLEAPVKATSQLIFDGTADFSAAAGGYSGSLYIDGTGGVSNKGTTRNFNIEITGCNATPTQGWISLSAAAIDAIDAPNLFIGGSLKLQETGGFEVDFDAVADAVAIRTGAILKAADVFLMALKGSSVPGAITIESGATIDTLGMGSPAFDSLSGYFFANSTSSSGGTSALALSNGYLNVQATNGATTGPITVDNGASLFSDGSIAFATSGTLNLGESVNYGAKYIGFATIDINIGTSTALAAAKQDHHLPTGLLLDQALLDQLLQGDPSVGAPALEILTLEASQSINIYGSIDLNTINPVTGKSTLDELVLDTPAVYGDGKSSDTATITTGTLVWNGVAQQEPAGNGLTTWANTPAGPVIPHGPGTGSGTLNIIADEIIFGYAPADQPQNIASLGRLVLGFSNVNLTASQEITANSKGSLSVYLTETAPGTYTGGNLTIITPLLTGGPGSVLSYKAGGALTLMTPSGVAPTSTMTDSLGAEIDLSGNTISDSTSIFAASGKVTLTATGNIDLNASSVINVSGLTVAMFDQNVPTFGGDVELESTQGNISQATSSVINVSADGANAGGLTIIATGTSGGLVSLNGTLLGSTTGNLNAGSFDVEAQNFGDFVTLNQLLDTGGFFYLRSFDVKQGDVDIPKGTTISAHTVTISVDNGSLTLGGTINASGTTPGTIRLSSSGNLELQSTAILDVHSTALQVDSYGQPIFAENQGVIELTVADGTNTSSTTLNNGQGSLLLDTGATINMSSPDGVDRGDLELNVPRTGVTSGNVRLQANGKLNITGAQTLAVNAFWTYAPTDADGTIVQSAGTGVPTGAIILDQVSQDSATFITNALSDGGLSALSGLTAYRQAFHLRPGVEIVSETPNGNLTVLGDLDLSKYRYESVNPNSPLDSTYGSGEPGVLILRAGGNLNIYGSINDGFAPLNLGGMSYPDENGWVLFANKTTQFNIFVSTDVTLVRGTTFANNDVSLNYAIEIGTSSNPATINQAVTIPATVTLLNASQPITQPFLVTAEIVIPGGRTFHAGQTISPKELPGGVLPTGTIVSAGSILPVSIQILPGTNWPAGASLAVFASPVTLANSSITLTPGDLIPAGSILHFGKGITMVNTRPLNNGIQGQIYAVEPMLSLGPGGKIPLSWSISLVAGADTGAADTETLQAQSALDGSGNLVLDDLHYNLASDTPIFSVIRTGTGYLDLLAGGNFTEESLYGIYTAGAQTSAISGPNGESFNLPRGEIDGEVLGPKYAGTVYEYIADNDYQAYYPNGGGNVLVSAHGNLTGFSENSANGTVIPSYNVNDWLWSQGGISIGEAAAWWINFGTYVIDNNKPVVAGFTGIGALGGGNVTVITGGNAGVQSFSSDGVTSGSLVVAVGSTGRITSVNGSGGGSLVETGGGDVTIDVGGALNPVAAAYGTQIGNGFSGGNFIDLRGSLTLNAGSIGGLDLVYGLSTANDPLPTQVSTAAAYSYVFGGPVLTPGDATINLEVRGDLVIGNADNPGISPGLAPSSGDVVNTTREGTSYAESLFSLWTTRTAISAISVGGNLVPTDGNFDDGTVGFSTLTGLFPGTLKVFATSGSIYSGATGQTAEALELAPSPTGELEMLAENSIYTDAGEFSQQSLIFEISGAGSNVLSTPFNPAWYLFSKRKITTNTFSPGGINLTPNLFAFGLDSATGTLHADDATPALIYAVTGDIIGLQFGQLTTFTEGTQKVPEYIGAKAVDIRAGNDIVNFGESESDPSFILNNSSTDVSVVSAGNEILFANVDIAGPGNLEVSAGGNVYQGAQADIISIGLIGTPKIENPNGGAGIYVFAGVSSQGPNWTSFANLYLNPDNLANSNGLLVDQPGKVIETYQDQLVSWLQTNFGFSGSATAALAYFESLPVSQQSIFLLQVFFGELNESGLEYNDPTSRFYQSYVRGQEAIAALFPTTGTNGQTITYNGSLTMFSALNPQNNAITDASILTDFGGNITTIVPGGDTIVGVTGVTPGAHAGILTQGSGNIDMYSEGSVLLGESRILTTYGGSILIWSAGGDINAGIGAKGTIIFAPPGIVYDDYSDIILSPTTPSSGAGIGTLDPIPGIPPGDLNLVAPEGTIDAGEAGIRASGNANLAARVIVNAANISVSGKTTGIPTVVSPNVAAVTAASNAAGANTNAANEVAKQQANQAEQQPESVIIVEVLGYGGGDSSGD